MCAIHHDEPDVYFYHSDHLGSASWITDNGGVAVQHLQYLPYGERYVDQRVTGYQERFTFTGKERDEETGYGYFGARYMDHELTTMWLSVDPMSDKYPGISPYAYCAWNPVKLVDPDGNDWYEKNEKNGNSSINYCENEAACPKDGRYLGQAYILFEGSINESSVNNNGKRSITAPGAVAADVTVFGPNGEKDIKHYIGYTMTSNPEKFGAIADGEYVGRSDGNKGGSLPSKYWIYNKEATKRAGKYCCYIQGDRVNTNPDSKNDWNYGTIYKDGIFIHSTGSDGNLNLRNSTGCLLINDKQWNDFKKQMEGVNNYTVQVTRTYPE